MNKQELKSYLEQTFPQNKVEETFDFPLLFVDKADLISVVTKLRDSKETLFDFLFCETAVDKKTHFEMVYHLNSTTHRHDMELKVILEDRDNAVIESLNPIYTAADLYECEIYDMFGIRFNNHPHLRRIMLGEEWKGYPLRKDYTNEGNELSLK